MTDRTLYLLFECFGVVLETLIIFQYINDFSKWNCSKLRLICGYVLFCAGLMYLSVFLRQPIALITYCGLGIFVLVLVLHKGSISSRLYLPLSFCILVVLAEFISTWIVTLMFKVSFESALEFGTARAVAIVIAKLVLFIMLKLSRVIAKSIKGESNTQDAKLSLPLYFCPILSIALTHYVYIIGLNTHDNFSFTTMFSLLAILYLNFVVFWYFDSIKAIFEFQLISEAAEARLEQQIQYYTQLEKHQNETIALRHDMRRHILLVKSLISEGYREISEEYVSELEAQLECDTPLIQTPHPVISALLTAQKIKAQEAGIDMRVSVNLVSDINTKPADLCVLIGNIVDNAIEACEFLPKDADKYIAVKIAQRDSKLLIHVENPYIPGTKKANNDGKRGFGLKNVNKVVASYGGLMELEAGDRIYKVKLLIP